MGEVEASLFIVIPIATYYVVYCVVGDFIDILDWWYSRED